MARNCPLNFINIIECWFDKQFTCVKWCNSLSRLVSLPNGLRQGSILSPILFSVYTNDLLETLHNSNLGCHIKYMSFNAFMYADDLLLLSLSLSDLQKMLDLCSVELKHLDMCINVKKSCSIRIGKHFDASIENVFISGIPVPWSNKIRYLGIFFLAGKNLKCDFHETKAKYFGSLNSLLGKIGTKSLTVALSLTAAKCFPILLYGLETVKLYKSQLSNLSYVYNAIFSKLFSTFDQKVIEQCQFYMGILPLQYRIDLMRLNFLDALKNQALYASPANTLFITLENDEYEILCVKYNIPFNANAAARTKLFWTFFTEKLNISMNQT